MTQEHPQVALGKKIEEELKTQIENQLVDSPEGQAEPDLTDPEKSKVPEGQDNPENNTDTPPDTSQDTPSSTFSSDGRLFLPTEEKRISDLELMDHHKLAIFAFEQEHAFKSYWGSLSAKDKKINELSKTIHDLMSKPIPASDGTEVKKKESSSKAKIDLAKAKEEFGEDYVEMVSKVAESIAEEKLAQMEQPKANDDQERLKNQVLELQQQSFKIAHDRFVSDLRTTIPNFDVINSDKPFMEWLEAYDPLMRGIRKEVLGDCVRDMDIDAVGQIFDRWVSLNPARYKNISKPVKTDRKSELEQQIQPGKAKSTSQSTGESSLKKYTRSDLKKLNDSLAKGDYRGRMNEYEKKFNEMVAGLQP